MKVSVVIPVYNEEKYISRCLDSLLQQTLALEIIVIDDGSTDKTLNILSNYKDKNIKIFHQAHFGPAIARNKGVGKAVGDILVFVDSDMTFETDFVEKLIKPILEKKTIGTFSKEEYVLNEDNIWSKCWNIEKGLPLNRMHNLNHPDLQSVFRAILKKEFQKVGGFSAIGYIDDHTLSIKLGIQATVAEGAKFYHQNPQTLDEVYQQARWIGKSEYKMRKIKSEWIMRFISILRYSLPFSLLNGLVKAVRFNIPEFLIFKFVYDLALEISLVKSLFKEQKNK